MNFSRLFTTERKLLLSFFALAFAASAFFLLAGQIARRSTIAFDRSLLVTLREPGNLAIPAGPSWLSEVMTDMTAFGSNAGLLLITLIAIGYFVLVRRFAAGAFVIAAVGSGMAAASLLKHLFHRTRPEVVPHLAQVTSASFPSGHALDSALVYLTLAALIARGSPERRVRIYVMTVALALTLLIGVSRVYLGVHWPTDVIGGWMIGSAWAYASSLLYGHLLRRGAIGGDKAHG